MWLLFGRDKKSNELARSIFFGKSPFYSRWYRRSKPKEIELEYDYIGTGGHLGDYDGFRPHLAHIQERMKSWRPSSFSELFIPSYYDRFTWFTAIFGAVLGIIGALNLVTSIIQITIAWKAWKEPVAPPVG